MADQYDLEGAASINEADNTKTGYLDKDCGREGDVVKGCSPLPDRQKTESWTFRYPVIIKILPN